jgi:hypothetical protein
LPLNSKQAPSIPNLFLPVPIILDARQEEK